MRAMVAGAVCGAWLLQRQAELPAIAVLAALALVAVLVPKRHASGLVAAGALAGFAWAGVLGHHRLADALAEERDVVVTGVVAGLPQPQERGARFVFDVEEPR